MRTQAPPQKAQLSFAHTKQPRHRWWERKGSLRSHILGNCQQSQLRFSKPLQSEPAASSLTCQPTPVLGFSHPLDQGAPLANCVLTPPPGCATHLVGSRGGGSWRAPAQGPATSAQTLLRAGSLKLPKSSVMSVEYGCALVLINANLSWTEIK